MSLKQHIYWNTLSGRSVSLHLGKEMIGLICCWLDLAKECCDGD